MTLVMPGTGEKVKSTQSLPDARSIEARTDFLIEFAHDVGMTRIAVERKPVPQVEGGTRLKWKVEGLIGHRLWLCQGPFQQVIEQLREAGAHPR